MVEEKARKNMPITYEPRFFEHLPAQTFWLEECPAIVGTGREGKTAAERFIRILKGLPYPRWRPPRGGVNRTHMILFKDGRPGDYLKKMKPGGRAILPAGDSGNPGAESFRLEVSHRKIVVHAATCAGFRHASLALWEMFDAEAGFFTGGIMEDEPAFPFRAFLLSLAHDYKAPHKGERRKTIKRFDLDVALSLIRRIAGARFNAVMIDVENAVRYCSHPEIARSHSAPMDDFRRMVRLAKDLNLEVIPKTNFSKSYAPKHRHNDWFEPYHLLADGPEYFRRAGQIVDELIAVAQPRYYQIGMDEDHARDADAYIAAVMALRAHLLKRNITPIIWIDLEKGYQPKAFQEKMKRAVEELPRERLVLTHWQYYGRTFRSVGELRRKGYLALGGTSLNPRWKRTDANRAFALRAWEQGAAGMVGSCWLPILPETKVAYERAIDASGRAFWAAG
jgi:hypothetical protein